MSASAWEFYNRAKKHLMDGSIDLDGDTFRISLFTSASNAASALLSTIGSVTGEVAEGFGYSSSGKALAGVTWGVGASASEMRWNSDAVQWVAVGGNIINIKHVVIWKQGTSAAARKLLLHSQLSTSQYPLTSGNSLTINPSANGIFELN